MVGRGGETRSERERERGWVAIGNPRSDQCHAAFIVLQQKGAHQSTGISSRLISRGRCGTNPTLLSSPSFHPSFLLSLLPSFPPSSFSSTVSPFLVSLKRQRSFHPPPDVVERRVPTHWRWCSRAGADSGSGPGAVVMKTYEIYSIWADAITPPPTTDRPPLLSPPPSLDPRTPPGDRCWWLVYVGVGRHYRSGISSRGRRGDLLQKSSCGNFNG